MISFTTDRLCIRPVMLSDYEDITAYGCDSNVGKYMIDWPKTEAELRKYVTACVNFWKEGDSTWYEWVIELNSNKKVIGSITLAVPEGMDYGELEWLLNKDYWNQGFMTEALMGLFAEIFSKLGLRRVRAACDDRNIATARVMEKCGMTCVGIMKDLHSHKKNEEYIYNRKRYVLDK